MSEFDLDSLLEPVSATAPSGEDPAYTSEFQPLLDAADGQPERRMGDSVMIPAVAPDWKQVMALGIGLFARGKDLRIAVLICRALPRCWAPPDYIHIVLNKLGCFRYQFFIA